MKMKKAYIILISFFSLTIMFSVCYYLSYKSAINQFNKNSVGKDDIRLSYQKSIDNSSQETSSNTNQTSNTDYNNTSEDAVEANSNDSDYITPSTEYILQEYEVKNGSLVSNKLNTPDYLIGLTREGVMKYVSDYMQDVPLADYEKGLTSFQVVSFSKEKVILRKSYNSDLVQYKYYLAVQDGLITVYYSDKKTVFEYTDIEVKNLPEQDQIELNHGKYIKDADELYGILESYTS